MIEAATADSKQKLRLLQEQAAKWNAVPAPANKEVTRERWLETHACRAGRRTRNCATSKSSMKESVKAAAECVVQGKGSR